MFFWFLRVAYKLFLCQILSIQWTQLPNQIFALNSAVYTLVFMVIWDTKISTLNLQQWLMRDLQTSRLAVAAMPGNCTAPQMAIETQPTDLNCAFTSLNWFWTSNFKHSLLKMNVNDLVKAVCFLVCYW